MRTTMLKTSGSISSHTSKKILSFPMDKLIGYGVELFTHSFLQGLYYFIIYINRKLKVKYEFTFLLYRLNIYIYIYQYCHGFMTGFEGGGAHGRDEQWDVRDTRV
jgi:hypothetical protein